MGRTIFGSLLFTWSLIVIPANLGNQGFFPDLVFGFLILILGLILLVTGIGRLLEDGRNRVQQNHPGLYAPRNDSSSAGHRITEGIVIGVVSGVILPVLQKVLGG
jgi:xanthine/uracil permease